VCAHGVIVPQVNTLRQLSRNAAILYFVVSHQVVLLRLLYTIRHSNQDNPQHWGIQKMNNSIDLLAPVWTHMTQVQPVRGEGVYLYDAAGRRYTDFTSGIGVTNTGHAHPRVVQAIQQQASALIFGQMNIVITPAAAAACRAD
jgi:4-aminobutyrate aminotransferase-like enzyme